MKRSILGAAALLSMAAAPAAAQTRHLEVGVDAAFTSIGEDGEPAVRLIELPRWLRVGTPLGDHLLLEASMSWRRIGSNGSYISALELHPSLSWLWREEGAVRPYVGVVAGWSHAGGGGESDSQASLGTAAGVRIPLAGPAILRLEVGFDHAFESDQMPRGNRFRLGVGLSVRVR